MIIYRAKVTQIGRNLLSTNDVTVAIIKDRIEKQKQQNEFLKGGYWNDKGRTYRKSSKRG